jgi:hypothetical protein
MANTHSCVGCASVTHNVQIWPHRHEVLKSNSRTPSSTTVTHVCDTRSTRRIRCGPCGVGGVLGLLAVSRVDVASLVTMEVPLVEVQRVASARDTSGDAAADSSGRVTISRRRVESMLVDAYREKLSGMTDAELSRLFESEVLREFPSGSILGGGEKVGETAGETAGEAAGEAAGLDTRGWSSGSAVPAGVAEVKDVVVEGEVGASSGSRDAEAEAGTGVITSESMGTSSGVGSVVEAVVARVFGEVRDPKEVAVPVMGTGALVLGVALMYRLISTLSVGGEQKRTEGDAGGRAGSGQGPPQGVADPYTRYESMGSGEVIWQRQEGSARDNGAAAGGTSGGRGRGQPRATEIDPWRTPLPGSGTNVEDTGAVGDVGDVRDVTDVARVADVADVAEVEDDGRGDDDIRENTGSGDTGNLPTAKDVLDNAEDVKVSLLSRRKL